MSWTVAAMTEQEYMKGPTPFFSVLQRFPGKHPIFGISERHEPDDYQTLSAKFGKHDQFLVMNADAASPCEASVVQLRVLGSIEREELKGPSVLLRS
jgi:hypothetical protein